jgi:hypothetical protein
MPNCGEDYPGNASFYPLPEHKPIPDNKCCIEERQRIARYLQRELDDYEQIGLSLTKIAKIVKYLHEGKPASGQ